MVLPHVIDHFFRDHKSRHSHSDDPETGLGKDDRNAEDEPKQDEHSNDQVIEDRSDDANQAPHSPANDDDDTDLAMDEELDENDLIRDVDQEDGFMENDEDQGGDEHTGESHSRSQTLEQSSTLATISTLSISSYFDQPPAWVLKIKAFMAPDTTNSELESYVPTYRYAPILSGIVIPFSILLAIPGLTANWYIRTEQNKIVETKPNSTLLDVALGFGMAFALLANICLIIRFMERKVAIMTYCCVVFLTLHDIISIIVLMTFGLQHRFSDGFTYGQAYWMTLCSTVTSSFTNLTLIIDAIKTRDFANSGSGLTRKQRALMIIVIILLCQIALGGLIQSILMDLSFINAMYFTVVSIETIGFGDIHPTSTSSRVFTCIYSVFGILNLALAVGLARSTLLEGIEISYRKRVRAVRERRRMANWERRVVFRWRQAVEWRLRAARKPIWAKDVEGESARTPHHSWLVRKLEALWPWPSWEGRWYGRIPGEMVGHGKLLAGLGMGTHPHGMHLNLDALSRQDLEAASMETGVPLDMLLPPGYWKRRAARLPVDEASETPRTATSDVPVKPAVNADDIRDMPLTHARMGRMIFMLGNFALAVDKSSFARNPGRNVHVSRKKFGNDRRAHKNLAQQYDSFRAGMEKEEGHAYYTRLTVAWVLFLVFWMVGAAIFMVTENWSYGIALYFCFIAFTTIGYGDYHPETPAGRSIFVVWALLGVATMTMLISILSEAYSFRFKNVVHSGAFARAVKHYKEKGRHLINQRIPAVHDIQARATEKVTALSPPKMTDSALEETRQRVSQELEALPSQILRQAEIFREYMQYLTETDEMGVKSADSIPEGLKHMVSDIIGRSKQDEKLKREILVDQDAKRILLTLSVEEVLQSMTNLAENALDSLTERGKLEEIHRAHRDRRSRSEGEAGEGSSSSPES